jgi:hypothetical protein
MVTSFVDVTAPIPADQLGKIAQLENNAIIIRLHFTINHLSRWLSPIHDEHKLERSAFRGEPSPKQILIGMRDEEHRVFPRMFLIANEQRPNLDRLPEYERTPERVRLDEARSSIALLAHFRRLRQSTCSLLRSLPDDAWDLTGVTRKRQNETIRGLALDLVRHDYQYLRALDVALDSVGARDGLAEIQKTHLDELLNLAPDHLVV